MARYKLNDKGRECAEELLNKIKQRSNYYDDLEYWEFVVLADKQEEVEQDILKSKLDKEFLQLLLSIKKENYLGS